MLDTGLAGGTGEYLAEARPCNYQQALFKTPIFSGLQSLAYLVITESAVSIVNPIINRHLPASRIAGRVMVKFYDAEHSAATTHLNLQLVHEIERALKSSDKLNLHLVGAHLNQALIEAQRACDAVTR